MIMLFDINSIIIDMVKLYLRKHLFNIYGRSSVSVGQQVFRIQERCQD